MQTSPHNIPVGQTFPIFHAWATTCITKIFVNLLHELWPTEKKIEE